MKKTFPRPKSWPFITGLSSIVLSLVLFLFPFSHKPDGLCLLHFSISVIYGIYLFIVYRRHKNDTHYFGMACWLVLCLISCYALNREMNILNTPTLWFGILQAIAGASLLSYAWISYLPQWGRQVLLFIAGISLMVFLYLACYLLPLYGISVAIFFVLGISLHTFVPLCCCIFIYYMLRKTATTWRLAASFFSGAGVVLLLCIAHIIWWNQETKSMNLAYQRTLVKSGNMLPPWMSVSQQLPQNLLTKRILETDLVYEVPDLSNGYSFWEMPHRSYDEPLQHDPLIMMSSLFSGPLSIPEDDRISMLESLYNKRHAAQERLWSGKGLQTTFVNTAVQLWPALHLAYTEMNVSVRNNQRYSWSAGEAIYTFHVPEGGVATSLSLWIDGKESKGILTSKEKADSAYKTIVNVERRDPSVVHWQEGNTVTVRVFPVAANSERMFKIGISSPLPVHGQELSYTPIYFEGPSAWQAHEDVSISLQQDAPHFTPPAGFSQTCPQQFKRSGRYLDDWTCTFNAPPLDERGFVFNDNLYTLKPLPGNAEAVVTKTVYLDINASWSQAECEQVFELVKDRPVFVSPGNEEPLKRITAQNKSALFGQLRRNHFSLFPFYEIPDAATALVVTKNDGITPSLKDLQHAGLLNRVCLLITTY
ncbi:XrtN system VIT domain protein [Chitinophaga costaii]|uniref:XrtN system VIT domain protein n=1 Tax=Chitinophaga costaii TaxID=1335309 RepID=A0A1C4EUS6_9BACT|nr:XrtN system VIT domain-containing protein [Chitinophaga costaii]PUZ21631.1 XrtN system VIT domain-containing protein [Chitinophaga costaii]SCC47397.1 XrtN system VIT domain protein [Chitinophaga costaii]